MRESTLRGAILVVALIGLGLAGRPVWAQLAAEPAVFHERDFAQNPGLAARPHDVVVLELEAVRRGGAMRQNLVRYWLDAGTHTFCLDADDSHVTGLVVEDAAGRPVLELHLPARQRRSRVRASAPGRCARTVLPSDTYQLRFIHDGRLITGASRVAFVQAAPPSPSLLDPLGKPVGGWWALRPDPSLDPRRREGRVVLGPQSELVAGVRPLVADFASKQIDDASLFDVHDTSRPLVMASGRLPLDLAKLDASPYLTLGADDPTRTQTFFRDTTPLVVTDLGQYRAQLGVRRTDRQVANVFLGKTSPASVMLNYDQPRPDPAPPAPVDVLFRFFPDGTQIGELREGEIALFQECNYRGKGAVFAGRTPNLAELSSAVVTLAASAASVKLGNNTGVILHTGPVYTGTKQIVEVDTPCLDATPIKNNTTASLEVKLLAPTILLSTRSCVGCKLVGADLSGYDLSEPEIDLESADLTRANLTGSTLLTPRPNGSILKSVKLANATLDEAIGFARADHSLLDLSNTSLKRVDLSNATLYGAKLNGANLEGANLSGVLLTNNPCSVAPPLCQHPDIKDAASLTGAHLKNVNLTNAQLNGADFGNASFYGDNAAADRGCDTSNGFLDGCASAKNATMNSTNFSGAYLYGVDFQEATIRGVNFANAVLVGASFAGATLARDPIQGTLTRFTAAFLQGAKINEATTIDQVSFVDAFLDFTVGGNNLTLLLDGTHTVFHGWKERGRQVCLSVTYGNATTVPETISTLTCPDGGAGACGQAATPPCGQAANPRWESGIHDLTQTNPSASYSLCATYTPAAAPVCATPDDDW